MKLRPPKLRILTLIILAIATGFLAVSCSLGVAKEPTQISIKPENIADYIYRVIKSDRTIYGKVVQRLGENNVIHASENWEEERALPLPAQMLTMSSELSSKEDSFSYGSISPWSLNEAHAPSTPFEKQAMQSVLATGQPYRGEQTKDGKRYFSSLYPDKAVSTSCAECHNKHPVHQQRYPNKVFKVGDVMGGIMINIPFDDESYN